MVHITWPLSIKRIEYAAHNMVHLILVEIYDLFKVKNSRGKIIVSNNL